MFFFLFSTCKIIIKTHRPKQNEFLKKSNDEKIKSHKIIETKKASESKQTV